MSIPCPCFSPIMKWICLMVVSCNVQQALTVSKNNYLKLTHLKRKPAPLAHGCTVLRAIWNSLFHCPRHCPSPSSSSSWSSSSSPSSFSAPSLSFISRSMFCSFYYTDLLTSSWLHLHAILFLNSAHVITEALPWPVNFLFGFQHPFWHCL